MDTPAISLVVTTYNRADLLAKTLGSIRRVHVPPTGSVEVIVVDNNSVDNTADVVDEASADFPFALRYVRERSQGLSYARNRGLAEAVGRYIVFMDDDELIEPHYLGRLESAFDKTGADCLGGPIYYYNADLIPPWLYTLSEDTGQFFYGDSVRVLTPRDSKKLHGGNMAFRRTELAAVGGYRVELGRRGGELLSGEDYELQDRLWACGKKIVYHPGLIQYHYLRPERLSKRYWRKLYFSYGRTLYRHKAAVDGHGGVRLLGAPRWMWRGLVTRDLPRLVHPLCIVSPSRRLLGELAIWSRFGQIYEARRASLRDAR